MSNDRRRARQYFEDGSFVEYSITAVPRSAAFPEGVKYRFQYVDLDDTPILRYDNSHGVHERHRGPSGEGRRIEFEVNAEVHLRRFSRKLRSSERADEERQY